MKRRGAPLRTALRSWGVIAIGLFLGVVGQAAGAESQSREIYGRSATELGLYMGNNLLSGWRVPEAREIVDRLLAEDPESPDSLALEAQVLFFEGRYAEALERLRGLGVEGPFFDLVAATEEATRDFRSEESEHFQLLWGNPQDEVMVAPALAALEAAREALVGELGFEPHDRVRVEIYPTAAAFTAVSTLTRKEVETSGTIGLCKFDRLMVTSPRATLWGYRWRDTLCHEYVHLALYRRSHGLAPIWVHEGIAKYLEGSWRGAIGQLEPASQALLARRMEEGNLISLEAMSPSVAKLPTAEDTTLAFAEVGTMMAFLVQERGGDALRRLVEGLGSGLGDREALEAVWGSPFATFDGAWRGWVERLPLERKEVQVIGLQLAEHGKAEQDAPGAIPDPRARDFARLGDLLRGRGRDIAAAAEYAKAYAEEPDAPGIASRQALGLLARGRFEEAAHVADGGLRLYPDLAVLWYRKGEALLSLERPDDAARALEEVLEINPFHVPARNALLLAARAEGDEKAAARQEWALKVLGGQE
jgi:tetratricopeptide (TPR) repeat protein